ncbi:hypothetical protein [Levilactobacillus acidifarinae]|uniref:Uncharacterized protein n=1 Tax=Levilactobacillus acidifarinae DSM 19394 = JCM 15949 TaxID=1423715 RepID=A0A0R1LU43_9LACO|nr:hypothetical protein [Levilactobacillus acidifarinae]KRK95015.1 hypothetical protein FD25_GL002200 [Levilactobacillus acidifarinae DSM 19394]GEO70760.1 hypothetical protein LAC03_26700 [Levilactobacillus acidifarinae]
MELQEVKIKSFPLNDDNSEWLASKVIGIFENSYPNKVSQIDVVEQEGTSWLEQLEPQLFTITTAVFKNCRIWHIWYGTVSPEKHEIDAIGWDSNLKKWVWESAVLVKN